MNILTAGEALELLNQRLQRPITRQTFYQSILPPLVAAGYARSFGTKQQAVIDGATWRGWWVGYIAERERRIMAGEWHSSRPYSAEEAETWRDGGFDDVRTKEGR